MKKKSFIQVVYEHKSGEIKNKFIEGIFFFKKIYPNKEKILLDLSNFCLGKDFEFDSEYRYLELNYVKPKTIYELYQFSKNKDIFIIGLDNCNFRLFLIFVLSKIFKFKLIFINFFGFFPQSFENKKFIKSKNFFTYLKNKFVYLFFRVLSIARIIPRIKYYFEASQTRIDNIKNSISYKIDKKLNLKLFSYFENIYRINSIYYDEYLSLKNTSFKDDYILFIDNGFDHPDRIINDNKINNLERDNYYKNLFNFLNKLKKIFNVELLYCKHPKSNYPYNKFFKLIEEEFHFPKDSTLNLIQKSKLVIFSETTLINPIILFKKKIILLKSKYLGNYLNSKIESIKKEIDLFSISLENFEIKDKDKLNQQISDKIYLYDNFIYKNIFLKKNISSFEQINKLLNLEN